MAKYDVNYSCGHFGRIQLFGKYEERERKIRWFEQYGVCPDCYREQKEAEKSIGCKEKEMSYREYKKIIPICRRKPEVIMGKQKR